MKSNKNAENDIALRRGLSAVYKAKKNKDAINKSLKDEVKKQELMDFIFGKSENNPIVRNNQGDII